MGRDMQYDVPEDVKQIFKEMGKPEPIAYMTGEGYTPYLEDYVLIHIHEYPGYQWFLPRD